MTAHERKTAVLVCIVALSCLSCATPLPYEQPERLVYGPTPVVGEADAPVPVAAEPAEDSSGPVVVDTAGAVLLALKNNPALAVEEANPAISRTIENERQAEFEPVLSAEGSHERRRLERPASGGAGSQDEVTEANRGGFSLSRFFPTGTTAALEASAGQTSATGDPRLDTTTVGLTVTQALLRGAGSDVNLASIRQARLDTLASEYELRGFAESLVAAVEKEYWDFVLAERQIEIFTESLRVSGVALTEMEERIRIGNLAEIELAAGQAEVALRREALINANGTRETSRLRLLQLMNPAGAGMWDRSITPTQAPREPEGGLDDVADHAALANRMRPELNHARLLIQRNELQLLKTRNGLLPRLDAFVALGKTAYADSLRSSTSDLDKDTYDLSAGLTFVYPLGNTAAKAGHQRAILSRAQSIEALDNLRRLVELDVRTAYIEVRRTSEQVTATAATRRLQEETLRGETEKFRVGKSTAFLVAQVQRDLLAGQIGEIRALVNYQKALVDLYRLDGSLLLRRGITAPGVGLPPPAGEIFERSRPPRSPDVPAGSNGGTATGTPE